MNYLKEIVKSRGGIVISLLIFINVLELFTSRGNVQNYGERSYIQVLYVLVLLLMFPSIIKKNKIYTPLFFLVILWTINLFINFYDLQISEIGAYVRMLLVFVSGIFFYEQFKIKNIPLLFLQLFCITTLISLTKKILERDQFSIFIESGYNGGDYVSLGLLFLLPLIFLLFNKNSALLLFFWIMGVAFLSLRRTTILGLLFSIPFYFSYLKSFMNKRIAIFFLLICFLAGVYIFDKYSDLILLRFADIFEEDKNGNFGSGRSEWYTLMFYSFFDKIENIPFGYGMGSVSIFLKNNGFKFNHAHNDFLEILYTFGLVGIFLWIKYLYNLFKFSFVLKKIGSSFYPIYICTFLMYIIIGLFSGLIFRIEALAFMIVMAYIIAQIQLKHSIST